jgi:hypothetical protein
LALQSTVSTTSQVFPDNQTEHKQTTSNYIDHLGKRKRTKTHRTQSCCETESTHLVHMYDDIIKKTTNTDVDPSLLHLQGVKGHLTNKLTFSLETQKDLEGQYTSVFSNKICINTNIFNNL